MGKRPLAFLGRKVFAMASTSKTKVGKLWSFGSTKDSTPPNVSFEDTPTIHHLPFVDPLVHFVAPPFRTIQSTLSVFSYFAYAEAVYLVGNQSDWKTSEDYVHMIVLPPKVVKRVGRPKKKRIPSVGEAPKLHKCGRCKEIGHSRLTCTNTISYTEKSSIQN
ncbi:MuDRA-like transposase [Cucumis melo var. makuwa]|uniref:MuDRA-like transposase n=1 Tax=Cucumis melo var. makuwa TaxID=1194695 RepID=A0A5D3CIE4_CUCMM|nr:MuDRA-like transposase [Cucumis melo var. makuwa]